MFIHPHSIYTFVTPDGTNIHIDSTALREWCLSTPPLEVFNVPVHEEQARRLVEVDKAVSLTRLSELFDKGTQALRDHPGQEPFDPLIFCKDGKTTDGAPDVMLVDGHHRYVLLAMMRIPFFPAYVLSPSEWQPFQLHGLPSYTAEELRNTPILKRNY
jgi:hypothetical protein